MKKLLFSLLIGIFGISIYVYADISVTQGAGTTIATDAPASVNYQKIKLADGTAGSTQMSRVDANGNLATTCSISGSSNTVAMYGVSAATMNVVSVSTSTAIQLDSPVLSGRTSIEIQNIDASASLWCGFSNNVTVNQGRQIKPGNSWPLSVSTIIDPFCISDGAASTNAIVSQVH